MTPVRIAIDARPLQEGSRLRGVGQYVYQLLKNLPTFEHVQWFIVVDRALPYPAELEALRLRTLWLGAPGWQFWVRRSSQAYGQPVVDADIDLFHFTAQYNVFELPASVAVIATVHDIIPLVLKDVDFQKYFHGQQSEADAYAQKIQALGQRALAILTPSQATQKDLVEHLNFRPEKIYVTPLGCDHFQQVETGRPHPKDSAEPPYALFVGALDTHKNIPGLIQGFAQVQDQTLTLVLAGPFDRTQSKQIKTWAKQAGIQNRVRVKGFVPADELAQLFAGATMFLFPSWYEGFGFPPLEAMRHGVPVVCSNRGALPEVVGDAALLIEPDQPGQLAEAVDRLQAMPVLRQSLVTQGRQRASELTWSKTVAATVKSYQACLA